MNKGKQATLFQSWGQKKKDTNDKIIDLCDGLDEDDDEMLAEAMERSMHEFNNEGNQTGNDNHAPDLCNISIGAESFPCSTQGLTQKNVPPGYDKVAGKLWIYPTNYPVREYQYNIVGQALLKNTMVTLPTGLGKTFIAAVVMYNFYCWYPQGKVVFMAPTKPLVAQQIEACYDIMGIPQEDTAEMTGTMAPTERGKVWIGKRVFFLTPQVIMNDLSRGTCPAVDVRCLVIDEAHKATGNHAYCQVVRELIKYTTDFRILALSATPGGDIKAVQQVMANLMISHIELRTEESVDIKPYSHERKVEKIVVPLGDELTSVKKKYVKIMDVTVNRLKKHNVLYRRDTTSLSKFLILKAREEFRQNPPPNIQRNNYGSIEGDFALAMSLFHGFELLQLHGSRSLYNYLNGILHGDKGYNRTRTELTRNVDFNDLMDDLREKLAPPENRPSQSNKPLVTGHPKMVRLEQVVLDHFNTFNKGDGETRVMIFSQYRDSVSEITNILRQHHPLIKVMSFIGQSSAGKATKGFTQKEQLKVMKDFRDGGYNTLVSTCVGEEGLDIGDVDLIVCFDAHKSPIRLVQRMGRTGRKREGRIVMLVTEGKEEQIYNQSQYARRNVHNAILNSAKTLHFYQNNPAMVPDGWIPQCHKMFITVSKKFRPTKGNNISATNQNKITSMLTSNDCKGEKDGGITKEEFEELKKFYSGEPPAKKLPEGSKMLSLGENYQSERENELSLSEWFPWQNRLQPYFMVDHSNQTKNFVEMVEFLELQEALDPNEDNYGQEMEVFLNEADILKPEQLDQDYGSIKHFFVSSEKKVKQKNKKISLLKPRRSDQLPEFEAMILSGESDDELPAIFDKKDTVNDELDADSINITYVTSKHTVVRDKTDERNRPRKRNTSCNSSIIKVIADTDVCDFVENVNNLSTINEENTPSETNFDHANTEDERVNIVSDSNSSVGFYDLENPDSTETNQNENDIHCGERCENFIKLFPTFSPCPADMMTSPQKTSDVDKDILFIVPEAPSLNELNKLVDDISHMTTLPEIDIGKLIEEWEKENTTITDRKYVLNDCNDIIKNKNVEDADSLKNINKFDNMTVGQNLSKENSDSYEFDESFVCNDDKETNLALHHKKKMESLSGNKHINTFSDFESPVKQVVIETSHKISDDFKSSCGAQTTEENVKNTSKVRSNITMVTEPVKSKYPYSIVAKEDDEMNVDVNKMAEDAFSGSDEDFMDTQANFMLENDDLLADLNSDESSDEKKHEGKSKADDSFNTNDNRDVSTDKQYNLNNEKSESTPIQNRNISVLYQSADALLFDDSFMDTSVFETVKTSIVDDRKPKSGLVESGGRIPSPSQFTFTQALACVHDSDSLDKELGMITPNIEQTHETRTVCVDENFTAIKEHKNKIDSEVQFTRMKPHTTLNDMDTGKSQLNLINDVVDMDNTEDFSDVDDEETELPLFDLGFDVDDDIIPPSPCMSRTLSQRSILKNSNQSVFSSRKSLSFLCNKSKIFESKSKNVLSPTREEVQQCNEDRIDTENEKEQNSYGFDISNNAICEKSNNSINERENIVKNKDQSEHNDQVSCLNDYFNDDSISDLQNDFEMLPTSPVLSGKRPSGHKHVISPFDNVIKTPLISKSKSPEIVANFSLNDSPSLDDSFVVRKKRKTALIIDSPVSHNEKDDFDDFKTPIRPVSAKTKHRFSSSSSEEESILKIKKSMKTVSFCVVDDRDDDFESDIPVLCDKKKRFSKGIKRSPDNQKRKSKSPANQFLVQEAEVSENEDVSTDDEDGSDLDQMEESFVSEGCTQLSQGQHDELQAIYLQSVCSPAGQDGRYKLQYDYDDNIDVYSQVPQGEESQYYDDSFVDDNVEEENSLLDSHEITIIDRDNIIDNESYVGPRTRWSKPNRSKKMSQILHKNRRKRVKRITDSSSEDEQCRNMNMSPANLVKKNVLVSPADIGQIGGKVSRSKRRQLISSSDEEQDSDSSEIMCSLKTRIADKPKFVESHCGRDLKQIHDNSSKSKVELTISKEREERISRQKEKQEEFKRNMINKQQNEKLDEKNSIVGNKSTSPSNVNDTARFSETSQFTDDTDLLLYTRHTDSKPVVIVDSREINGAQDIISALRFQHNLNVIVAQLDSCDYVVSIRMGIDRKQWSEFSNGSNCAKMTTCVQIMCDFYERPCLIIEKDKLKGDEKSRILHWTKYVDKTLVQLIHSKVTLFFTENQLETASIIADLCQLENRKNCAISCQVDLNTEQQNKVKFYRSIPHLSYVHSLFLCNNFITVTNFLRSDVKTIMTNGKMTEERAVHVYNYIRRTFDSQMLPSSYN